MWAAPERGKAGPGIAGSGESKPKRDELRRTESGVSGVVARDRGDEHGTWCQSGVSGTTEPGVADWRRFGGGGGVSSSTRMGDAGAGRFGAAADEENASGKDGVLPEVVMRERARRAAGVEAAVSSSSSSTSTTSRMRAAETREAIVGARALSPGASSMDLVGLGNGESRVSAGDDEGFRLRWFEFRGSAWWARA
jgi:hypothetical protein